jgi:hypothetical protein
MTHFVPFHSFPLLDKNTSGKLFKDNYVELILRVKFEKKKMNLNSLHKETVNLFSQFLFQFEILIYSKY